MKKTTETSFSFEVIIIGVFAAIIFTFAGNIAPVLPVIAAVYGWFIIFLFWLAIFITLKGNVHFPKSKLSVWKGISNLLYYNGSPIVLGIFLWKIGYKNTGAILVVTIILQVVIVSMHAIKYKEKEN